MRLQKWSLLALVAASGCAGATMQCNGKPCPPDLSGSAGDLGADDLAVADLARADLQKVYLATDIHAIDTGSVGADTLVRLDGVVLTTPVRVRPTAGGMCTYQAWVQDPAGAAPSGLQLFTVQPTIAGSCAAPPSSNGPFDNHAPDEIVVVRGRVFVQTFAGDGASLIEHSIAIDDLTTTGGPMTLTPAALDDPTFFGGYGAGFQGYEGMLVKLTCSGCVGGKLSVTFQPGPYLWGASGGLFGSEFAALWPGKPGANGTKYTSITGVANTFLTGSVEPRGPSDFVP